jgi:chromosome segregation ATPase
MLENLLKIKDAKAAVENLTAENETLANANDALKADLDEAQERGKNLSEELKTGEDAAFDLLSKVAQQDEEIAKLTAEAQVARQEATEVAATAGTKPVVAESDEKSTDELWEEYKTIGDPIAKANFYRENREQLFTK